MRDPFTANAVDRANQAITYMQQSNDVYDRAAEVQRATQDIYKEGGVGDQAAADAALKALGGINANTGNSDEAKAWMVQALGVSLFNHIRNYNTDLPDIAYHAMNNMIADANQQHLGFQAPAEIEVGLAFGDKMSTMPTAYPSATTIVTQARGDQNAAHGDQAKVRQVRDNLFHYFQQTIPIQDPNA